MKAKTSIMVDNHLFSLPNKLIIDYLTKKLNLSDVIAHNPYFIYKLFNIFSSAEDNNHSIKVYEDVIVIKTPYYEYEIVLNANNGLTVVIDETSDDYDDLYFKLRRIIEVIPSNNGMKIIRHEDVVTGSLVDFDCETTRSLKITSIDESGIVISEEESRITKFIKSGLFNQRMTITPCTLEEYRILLEGYKKQPECDYKYINRNDIENINISRLHNGKSSSETKRFSSKDLLEIIDLREASYNTAGMSKESLRNGFVFLDIDNEVEANLTNEVGRRLGISLNKHCIDNISSRDKKLVMEVLTPSKELKKKS